MGEFGPLFAHPGDLSTPIISLLPVAIALVAMGLCAVVVVRGRLGDTLMALGIVALPAVAFALSNAILLERSKSTEFCMSCHIMEPILDAVDAEEPTLAAVHISRGAVRTGESCYACHAGYGLWGDVGAKRAGFGHMVATLTGRYELPLRMSAPFNIDACLACHAEGTSFRAAAAHQIPDIQQALLSREMGCTGACHPAAHPPEALTGEAIE